MRIGNETSSGNEVHKPNKHYLQNFPQLQSPSKNALYCCALYLQKSKYRAKYRSRQLWKHKV